MDEHKLDLSGSTLPMDGSKEDQQLKLKEIGDLKDVLQPERGRRRGIYKKRYDFYMGNHDYTTIFGKTAIRKKGHPTAAFNYSGKTAKKIYFGLRNNPPKVNIPARKVDDEHVDLERIYAQSTEDAVDEVLKRNHFFYKAYPKAAFNQVVMGDGAIKVYPFKNGEGEDDWDIKITTQTKMDNLMVVWKGDDSYEFSAVIAEEKRTIMSIEKEFGIKIPERLAISEEHKSPQMGTSTWADGDNWSEKNPNTNMPEESKAPSVILTEYDDDDYYCIMIGNQFIEFVQKDDVTYPKGSYWTFIHNIPQPRTSWSISDLDDMMDPQIEFNEASNEERSYIRVGATQRWVAYNMEDFDPESMKAESGGVIFVNSANPGESKFEPLQTNVNTFPVDSYLNRIRDVMYDMGIPKVAFGAGGADSGRSKAIDYQSLVDLIEDKRKSWELALTKISVRIQKLLHFYFENKFLTDPATGEFVERLPDFDWSEVTPITQSDKIVNVLNKFQMGLPFRYVFQELGYRDVDAVIAEMRRESQDPELMEFRAKMYQLSGGILAAQARANQLLQQQEQAPPGASAPNPNQAGPTMVSEQSDTPKPAAQRGGTTGSYSTAKGQIEQTKQNLAAQGR